MKQVLLSIIASMMFFSCASTDEETIDSTTFTPKFDNDYTQCNTPILGESSITFNAGRVRSVGVYKNISKITATVDLSGLDNINWVNASFYMVNGSGEYCDAGESGSPYCNEIDFLETNGNVATQTTIHLNHQQSYEYAYLHSLLTNPCWDQEKMKESINDGIYDASVIDPTRPFDVITEFASDYSNMTTTFVQDGNTVVVYDFLKNAAATGSGLQNLDGLAESMDQGWKIVASLWQGYSPNPNSSYRFDDPACKEWSDVCSGKYIISNIKVTAEAEL